MFHVQTTDKEREKNVHVIWSFSAISPGSDMAAYGQTQYSPALQPPGPYAPYAHHAQGYSMPSYSECKQIFIGVCASAHSSAVEFYIFISLTLIVVVNLPADLNLAKNCTYLRFGYCVFSLC